MTYRNVLRPSSNYVNAGGELSPDGLERNE